MGILDRPVHPAARYRIDIDRPAYGGMARVAPYVGPIVDRMTFLPWGRDAQGNATFAAPSALTSLLQSMQMPGSLATDHGKLWVTDDPNRPAYYEDGTVPPSNDEMQAAAFDLAGMGMGASFAGAPAGALGSGAVRQGIRAFHGSPHTFDRFDMSRIGTGEGAQAYGHGLYFAEQEGIAKAYRDQLSGNNIEARNYFRGGEQVQNIGELQGAAEAAARAAGAHGDQARYIARDIIDSLEGMDGKPASQFLDVYDVDPQFVEAYRAAAETVGDVTYRLNPGSMYEVRINANPDGFLDWDGPLSEQPQMVRNAVESMPLYQEAMARVPDGGIDLSRLDGRALQTQLELAAGGREQLAAQFSEAGIPGIKYLDAGSRSAGDGSRNYVVFDDKLVEILRRYGLLPPLAAGGLGLLGGNEAEGL